MYTQLSSCTHSTNFRPGPAESGELAVGSTGYFDTIMSTADYGRTAIHYYKLHIAKFSIFSNLYPSDRPAGLLFFTALVSRYGRRVSGTQYM